jgi:hypothetical protein
LIRSNCQRSRPVRFGGATASLCPTLRLLLDRPAASCNALARRQWHPALARHCWTSQQWHPGAIDSVELSKIASSSIWWGNRFALSHPTPFPHAHGKRGHGTQPARRIPLGPDGPPIAQLSGLPGVVPFGSPSWMSHRPLYQTSGHSSGAIFGHLTTWIV